MAKSVTYNKRENEKKKQARRAEKQKKKEDRKNQLQHIFFLSLLSFYTIQCNPANHTPLF